MKRHFLTHRVGQLESYGPDAIFESETIPQPTTSNTGKAPRPIRTYNSKSYLSGRFRISEDESVAPPKRIEGFAFSTRESAITPSRGRSESGFDNDDLTQSGTNMMSEKHNSPSPEQTVPSPPSGLTQVDLEDDPMTDRTDLPDTPIIDHLIRPDLAELTIHNKTYFYASDRFYYFDNHRKVYSEESGTLMYDGASAVRTNEHCTLDFHLEGVPYWFDSDKLWSRDAKDKPYLVHTWQGESERIDCHMSMPEMLHHLLHHGCVNLSSLMDSRQNTAIIKNGGGFGDIWMGELNDGTQVAIKAWRGSFIEQCDYKTLKRAAREIYFWSRLKHENIHPLMGVIIFKGHYLGMISHWMENGNVYEYMRKNPNFDRYQMGVHIASGLAHMHQCNAVHGDLKACNILVSSDGVAMLTDFGLSTISEAGLAFSETTKTQARSMRWASPELLVEGTRSSKPSDIYALGMTILEIFTGTVPYPQCQTDIQVMLKLFQGVLPIRPLEEFKDNSRDNRLWELLESCWKREPDARPSAEQVVETLKAISSMEHE